MHVSLSNHDLYLINHMHACMHLFHLERRQQSNTWHHICWSWQRTKKGNACYSTTSWWKCYLFLCSSSDRGSAIFVWFSQAFCPLHYSALNLLILGEDWKYGIQKQWRHNLCWFRCGLRIKTYCCTFSRSRKNSLCICTAKNNTHVTTWCVTTECTKNQKWLFQFFWNTFSL